MRFPSWNPLRPLMATFAVLGAVLAAAPAEAQITTVTMTPTGVYKQNGGGGTAFLLPYNDTGTATVGQVIETPLRSLIAFPAPYTDAGCALGVTVTAIGVNANRLMTETRAGATIEFIAAGSASTNRSGISDSATGTGAVGIGSQDSVVRITISQPGSYGFTVNVNAVPPGSSCPFTTLMTSNFSLPNLFAVVTAAGSTSITPETGWWYSASEPGRGYAIEYNATTGNLFVGAFLYANDGSAIWYVSTCALSGGSCTGTLDQYVNGTTLGGSFQAPQRLGSATSMTLDFSSSTQGTLTWAGGTVSLSRFPFAGTASIQSGIAGSPASGWWYSATEPGTGWFIETQARADGLNAIFFGGFMYGASGQPVWYVTSGAMLTAAAHDGTFFEYSGGSSITGNPYVAPAASTSRGTVTLRVTAPNVALVTLPNGRVLTLNRFAF